MTTWTGTAGTVASGMTTGLSTILNGYRDAIKALSEALTSYTPTWVGSTTNPVIGNGTLTGRYLQVGKFAFVRIVMVGGPSTTVGSGTYTFALPAGVHAAGEQTLSADFYDGSNHFATTGLIAAGSSVVVVVSTKGGTSGSQVTLGSTSFSAGASAIIVCQGVIELA